MGRWGFVAEDPLFAELCDRIGITFIGPSAEAMRKLGDKIGAKLIAEEVGVPVAPWSRGAVDSVEEAVAAAADIGYPLMLKRPPAAVVAVSASSPTTTTCARRTPAPATRPHAPSAAVWSSSNVW